MNYIEAQIKKLVKQRTELIKAGMNALHAHNSASSPSPMLKAIAKRDIRRAIALNDKIIELKKDSQELNSLFSRRQDER